MNEQRQISVPLSRLMPPPRACISILGIFKPDDQILSLLPGELMCLLQDLLLSLVSASLTLPCSCVDAAP